MPPIISSFQHHTLTLTLNRPDKANAFNRDMIFELLSALKDAASNDEVRAIVITGAGNTFCAGQDITEMLSGQEKKISYLEHLRKTYNPLVLLIFIGCSTIYSRYAKPIGGNNV